jgi:hypothetical protein
MSITVHAGDLARRYQVVRFLARGGMGEVFEALDLELHEPIALKVLRPETTRDPFARERFKREIQLSRRITHPNVCRIFDLVIHKHLNDELVFLTMELLPGDTLERRLVERGRMSEAGAAAVGQLRPPLTAAHRTGSHRLCPERARGRRGLSWAVVTDFGPPRGGHARRPPQAASVGTANTWPPSRPRERDVGVAADIYAPGRCTRWSPASCRTPESPRCRCSEAAQRSAADASAISRFDALEGAISPSRDPRLASGRPR